MLVHFREGNWGDPAFCVVENTWMSRWKLGSKVIGSMGYNPNIPHL